MSPELKKKNLGQFFNDSINIPRDLGKEKKN